MKTCTCPHEATRNGFMRTGYNALCPFHGRPLPEVVVRPVPEPRAVPPTFCECGAVAGHAELCDFHDEN